MLSEGIAWFVLCYPATEETDSLKDSAALSTTMTSLQNGEYMPLIGQQDEKEESNSSDSKDGDKAALKSSMWQTVCNLVNDIVGTGLLALPYAIQKGGLVAIAALAIVPLICYYTGKILIDCLYVKDDNGHKIRIRTNFKDMAEACWPRYGGVLVFIIHVTEMLLLASLYLVLFGSLMYGILPDVPVPPRVWMVIAACVGFPTLFINNLSNVAWFSLLSVIALTIGLIIIMGYGASNSSHWELNSIPLWDTNGVPIALAIIIYSYACHPILPIVESNMSEPKRYNVMLALTYVFVFVIKIVFVSVCLPTFSSNIKDVITNSIPLRAVQTIVNSFMVLSLFFSYPFHVITIIHCVEDSIVSESLRSRFSEMPWFISSRVIMNFATLLPAVAIPHFALMMSFVSSLTAVILSFILPCTFHLCLQSEQLRWYDKCLDCSIIVFGILASGTGLVVSGIEIIKVF